jgi:hypothetical protein
MTRAHDSIDTLGSRASDCTVGLVCRVCRSVCAMGIGLGRESTKRAAEEWISKERLRGAHEGCSLGTGASSDWLSRANDQTPSASNNNNTFPSTSRQDAQYNLGTERPVKPVFDSLVHHLTVHTLGLLSLSTHQQHIPFRFLAAQRPPLLRCSPALALAGAPHRS